MKIKYIHASEPGVEKIHDTVVSLSNACYMIMNRPTQEEYDKHILENFNRDVRRGLVFSYEVIEDDKIVNKNTVNIPSSNTFILHMCDNEEEYESRTASLSMEFDSLRECIKQANITLKQNNNCFYGAYVTAPTNEVTWQKVFRN